MFEMRPLMGKGGKPRSKVAGVGTNDSWYSTGYQDANGKTITCPCYTTWSSMLKRVYNLNQLARAPSYAPCTVDEGWKTFSVFRSWMIQQDWQGKALDKDLLIQGNKHYGPDTCLFVTQQVNSLLILRDRARGDQPLGVNKTTYKGSVYFSARVSCSGKQKRLGNFATPEEAAQAYSVAKTAHAHELAQQQSDPRVRDALRRLVF